MNLEYQKLLQDHPGLAQVLDGLPGKVFSGKAHPKEGAKGVFLCYAMPSPPALLRDGTIPEDEPWVVDGGATQWYLYDIETGTIESEPSKIIRLIRSNLETPRKHDLPESTLSEIRQKIEKHIKNTYLKQVQARHRCPVLIPRGKLTLQLDIETTLLVRRSPFPHNCRAY